MAKVDPLGGAQRVAAVLGATVLATLSLGTGAAQASSPTGVTLTLAARVCPTYGDIMANRARNNIQESLKDLGPETVYGDGQPVSPEIEAATQPNCKPLPGWEFTLGTGYISRAVNGYWGSLSIITGQTRAPVETLPSIPLLDSSGNPTGQSIEGAVTIELTKEEVELAGRGSLWVQGGTTSDPMLSKRYPEEYGFGSLRCAIDNLNGDNVEWVGYPPGYRHMFCFAYYVKPPPTSGTIIIKKKVVGHGSGAAETFHFGGNVSFNPGGAFDLTVSPPSTESAVTFYRGQTKPGETPWNVHENLPPNWRLKAITCHSATAESETSIDSAKHEAIIKLAPEDTVTCTYEDEFEPPPGDLTVRKVSVGSTGTFGFKVRRATRPNRVVANLFATTLKEGLAVEATPAPIVLRPGDYTVEESSASKDRGTWVLTDAGCDSVRGTFSDKLVHVRIESGESLSCTFRNELRPTASLKIQKTTEHGVGTFGFSVVSQDRPGEAIRQSADVTREGEPFDAKGGSTDALFFEPYVIQEFLPPPVPTGHWQLTSVMCDGQEVPFAAGAALVSITEEQSAPTCLFADRFETNEVPVEETARVSVTKVADRREIKLGQKAGFTVTVTGDGAATAREVVLNDQTESGATLVSVSTSQGSCGRKLPLHCELGDIAKGAKATIRVVVTPHHAGRFENHAVVGLANPDPDFAKNTAHAHVLVRSRRKRVPSHKPSFTG